MLLRKLADWIERYDEHPKWVRNMIGIAFLPIIALQQILYTFHMTTWRYRHRLREGFINIYETLCCRAQAFCWRAKYQILHPIVWLRIRRRAMDLADDMLEDYELEQRYGRPRVVYDPNAEPRDLVELSVISDHGYRESFLLDRSRAQSFLKAIHRARAKKGDWIERAELRALKREETDLGPSYFVSATADTIYVKDRLKIAGPKVS